jgi:hypothetical protein
MDMSKYSGAAFLKVGDVKVNGPIRVAIVDIEEGKYGKPDLTFDDGTKLSLNATNNKTLCRAYGTDSGEWIDKTIELTLGEIEYQGKPQEAVLVQPVSPPIEKKPPVKAALKPEPDKRGDMDDEIPF